MSSGSPDIKCLNGYLIYQWIYHLGSIWLPITTPGPSKPSGAQNRATFCINALRRRGRTEGPRLTALGVEGYVMDFMGCLPSGRLGTLRICTGTPNKV